MGLLIIKLLYIYHKTNIFLYIFISLYYIFYLKKNIFKINFHQKKLFGKKDHFYTKKMLLYYLEKTKELL